MELARDRLLPTAFTEAVNHAHVYDPAGAVAAGYLDRVVPADEVVGAAVAHAAFLAGHVRPGPFRATRANARGAALAAMRSGLHTDVAEFVVELPED